jgi:formyltetrahydrofolate deformylase
MADGRSRAVVSVIGRDQKGVVARISTYLASSDVNIEDIEQRVMEGLFIMTMLVDLSDCSITLDELVTGLQEIAREINMEVKVRSPAGRRSGSASRCSSRRKATASSKLVRDRDAGKLAGDMVVVLSNHPTLEGVARAAGHSVRVVRVDGQAAALRLAARAPRGVKPDLLVLARYMQILSPKVIDRYPVPHHQHPSVAAAVSPRAERVPAGLGGRRARLRLHGTLRDGAARRGPGDPPGRLPHPRR